MLSKLAYAVVGLTIVALSFSATLFVLDQWSGDPSSDTLFTSSISSALRAQAATPAPAAPSGNFRDTTLAELPKPEGSGFSWIGIARLNVRAEPGASVVSAQPILRLTPTAENAPHTLAGEFNGLAINRAYRVTAWVKPQNGGNVEFEVTDQAGGQVLKHAAAVFDLSTHAVQSGDGAVKERGVEQGPDDWQKVWLNLTTSDGKIIIALRPVRNGTDTFKGDGSLGVILGGVQANPRG
jgi:hypothetical protein